jgi:hypothetical protein
MAAAKRLLEEFEDWQYENSYNSASTQTTWLNQNLLVNIKQV